MKKIILLFIITNIYALQSSQIKVLKTVKNISSYYKANDGRQFIDTLCSIALAESSAGLYTIGDSYFTSGKEKPFLLKSLGIGQVKLETAILMISKYPNLFKKETLNLIHENKFAYKKYSILIRKYNYFVHIYNRYIIKKHKSKRDKKVIKWSKKELKYYENKLNNINYKKYYNKDIRLAQKLLKDDKFNAKIMTIYFIHLYNTYKKLGYKDPYHIAISRYNGGLNNIKYKNKIKRKYKEYLTYKKLL